MDNIKNINFSLHLDSTVYLCDLHREQAWLRWITNQQHGVQMHKEEVLALLRSIAASDTEESCHEALETLKKSAVWQNKYGFQRNGYPKKRYN